MLHAARCKCRTQKKVAKNRHLGTIPQFCRAISSQLRHVSTIGKKLFKQQYLLYMSPQYGELRPTSSTMICCKRKQKLFFQHGIIHCVSKKNTDVAQYNFNAHQPMLVIYGRDVAESMLSNGNLLSHLS